MLLPLEIERVGDQENPPGGKYSKQFSVRVFVSGDVFKDIVGDDEIE